MLTRRRARELAETEKMEGAAAGARALMDYSQPKIDDIQSSIIRPAITAATFEIKPGTIQMVQN